jgi:outer membrane protein OmpA-like peptidoglycan-associated protein
VTAAHMFVAAIGAAVAFSQCGGAPARLAALDDLERVRSAAGAREGARLAPEMYARAEQERALAQEAHASGDDVGAALHAQRAVASYDHALAVARLARATAELTDAQRSLDDATAQEQALETSRSRLERDAQELEDRARVTRQRLYPAPSATLTPEREAARMVAARSLATQARLLCAAARLAVADAPGLSDADGEVVALTERLAKGARPAPIDDAARARAQCLDVLTRGRRGANDGAGESDALLAELSAAGGWDPARDERGVTVTLHDAFRGAQLTDKATARLKELGRVAASHATFAVQVVVHDATGAALNDPMDPRRAEAAIQALVSGGAAAPRVRAELAGAQVPIVDPGDAKARARNERLEVVFVGGR